MNSNIFWSVSVVSNSYRPKHFSIRWESRIFWASIDHHLFCNKRSLLSPRITNLLKHVVVFLFSQRSRFLTSNVEKDHRKRRKVATTSASLLRKQISAFVKAHWDDGFSDHIHLQIFVHKLEAQCETRFLIERWKSALFILYREGFFYNRAFPNTTGNEMTRFSWNVSPGLEVSFSSVLPKSLALEVLVLFLAVVLATGNYSHWKYFKNSSSAITNSTVSTYSFPYFFLQCLILAISGQQLFGLNLSLALWHCSSKNIHAPYR